MMDKENSVDVETASESYNEPKIDSVERKPRSRERGPDKKRKNRWNKSRKNRNQEKSAGGLQ